MRQQGLVFYALFQVRKSDDLKNVSFLWSRAVYLTCYWRRCTLFFLRFPLDLKGVFIKIKATSLAPHRPFDCKIMLLTELAPPKGCLCSFFFSWTSSNAELDLLLIFSFLLLRKLVTLGHVYIITTNHDLMLWVIIKLNCFHQASPMQCFSSHLDKGREMSPSGHYEQLAMPFGRTIPETHWGQHHFLGFVYIHNRLNGK